MKKFISIVLSLVILIGVFTYAPITVGAARKGHYQYGFIGSKGIYIENYYGTDRILKIPSSIDGYKVMGIKEKAFWCSHFDEVTIPNTVTYIGSFAFNDCNSLRKLRIGDKVKNIGNFAFSDCTSLRKITIGKNVKTIGMSAFENCTGLTKVTIPNKVTRICDGAFCNCIGLSSLTIGKNVKNIECDAFENCNDLKKVTIPKSVKKLHFNAFNGCRKLSNIYYKGTNHEWEKLLGYNGYIDKNYKFKNAKVHFLKKVKLSKCKVLPIAKQHYKGKKLKPNITIKDRKFYLFGPTDYKLTYKKNKNIGKATVIIKGKGCYTGKIKKTFRIVKGINPMKVRYKRPLTAYSYKKSTFNNVIRVKKAQGKVKYKKISGNSNINVNSKTGSITVNSGLEEGYIYYAKFKITASGNKKYNRKSKNIIIEVWVPYN